MNLLALCTRQSNNELIAAECQHLTGGTPDEKGVAECQSSDLIPQAAYIHTGLRLISEAATLDNLTAQIAALQLPCQDFRIDFLRLSADNSIRSREAIIAVADVLPGLPNLENPQHVFQIIFRANRFLFGEVVTKTEHSYHQHDEKPWHTSSSLGARLARAMVNLTWPAKSVFDPCCGTGSILLQACALGLTAYGGDKSTRMVGMTRKNLEHFGYRADVRRMDARQTEQTAEAIVTDLPYGRFCHSTPEEICAILAQAVKLAPLGIFVLEDDITDWLYEVGYAQVEVWHMPKRAGMARIIHRARHTAG